MRLLTIIFVLASLSAEAQVLRVEYQAHHVLKSGTKKHKVQLVQKIKMDECNTIELMNKSLTKVSEDPERPEVQRFVTDITIATTELQCESDTLVMRTVRSPIYEISTPTFTLYAPKGWELVILK